MIDFDALERAFAPIQDVGRQEISFEVEGQKVVLAPLLPSQETATQGYAREWVDTHSDDAGEIPKHIATEYMNVLRVEMLAYSLVEVNGLDLRKEEYVATGQKTEGGRNVRVQRHVAIRDLITKKRPWSRPMLEVAFAKYGELLDRVERDSNDLVKYEPSDLSTEHKRAQQRLADIENEMEKRAAGDSNLHTEQVKAIVQYDEANQAARRGAPPPTAPKEPKPNQHATPPAPEVTPLEPEVVQASVPEPSATLDPPSKGQWAEFDEMPTTADLRKPPPGPVKSLRGTPREKILPPTSTPPTGPPTGPPTPPPTPQVEVMDSFSDPEEPGVMQAEANRILEARKKMAEQRAASQAGGAAPVRRPPPHQAGAREDAVSLDATQIGHIGDTPAFRLPTMEISSRGRPTGRQDVDQPLSDEASKNPHFVPAKR